MSSASLSECVGCFDVLSPASCCLLPCLHVVCAACASDFVAQGRQRRHGLASCIACGELFDAAATLQSAALFVTAAPEQRQQQRQQQRQPQLQQQKQEHEHAAAVCHKCDVTVLAHDVSLHADHELVVVDDGMAALTAALDDALAQLEVLQAQLQQACTAFAELLAQLRHDQERMHGDIVAAFAELAARRPTRVRRLEMRRDVLQSEARTQLQVDVKQMELQLEEVLAAQKQVHVAHTQASVLRARMANYSDDRLRLYCTVSARLQELCARQPSLEPLVQRRLRFSVCQEPFRITIDRLGYVGRGRDYTELNQPSVVFGSKGDGPGQLRDPCGIAVTAAGELAVADKGNNRIEVFDAEGRHLRSLKLTTAPYHIAAAPNDDIWVCEYERSIVSRVSATDGTVIASIACPHPWCVAVHRVSGALFVSSNDTDVRAFSADGNELWRTREPFSMCFGLALFSPERLVVCDARNRHLQVLDCEDGERLGVVASGQLRNPIGVTVAPDSAILVAEHTGHHVTVWRAAGESSAFLSVPDGADDADDTLLHTLGSWGEVPGLFKFPRDVAVLVDGRVAVVDQGNHRIQVF